MRGTRRPESRAKSSESRSRSAPDAPQDPVESPFPHTLTAEDKASIRVLVVDDEESLCQGLSSVLKHEGYAITSTIRGSEAEDLVRKGSFDVILLDLYMSGVPGSVLLERALAARPEVVVVVMTGKPSVESSIQALRDGAWDYLPKPFSATHLQVLMGRAAHSVLVARETARLQEEREKRNVPDSTISVLGEAPSFRKVLELARKVAATDASVFISGESGTGKEMLAQFIHEHSRRRSREMVAVNCAAIPETLLESEMFGHLEGSFTGAIRDKAGLLETANGGTLFLDELSEMSPTTQAKLLRVIQDGVVRRIGSNKVNAVVNVRFIAATNRDPMEAVRDGLLREDLYYRLRVVPLEVPPLRERPSDIPLLARHFMGTSWLRHRGTTATPPVLTDEAIRELQQRPWKGNVRELENVMEHLVVIADPGEEVMAGRIPLMEGDRLLDNDTDALSFTPLVGEKYHAARERLLARFEKGYLSWVLQEADGNMSEAARIAGVDRTTLYRLLDKNALEKRELVTPEE